MPTTWPPPTKYKAEKLEKAVIETTLSREGSPLHRFATLPRTTKNPVWAEEHYYEHVEPTDALGLMLKGVQV